MNGTRLKRSKEEILDQSARIIAGTIDPEKMGLTPEEVDVENFIKNFKVSLSRLLLNSDTVYLAIGTYLNTDSSGIYSNSLQEILHYIETEMKTKFYFHHGIALWISKNDLFAVWLPQ